MNCAVHPEIEATGFCRNCGKPLCPNCTRDVHGVLYCEPCLASMVAQTVTPAPSRGPNPALAFVLGWVPGLGAVYNGEYVKALIHVAVFAALVTIDSHGMGQPFWGLMTGAFCCYMPIEAYYVAQQRLKNPAEAAASPWSAKRPVGPIVLIVLGVLLLLNTMDILNLDRVLEWFGDYGWPLVLIGIGAMLLYRQSLKKP